MSEDWLLTLLYTKCRSLPPSKLSLRRKVWLNKNEDAVCKIGGRQVAQAI